MTGRGTVAWRSYEVWLRLLGFLLVSNGARWMGALLLAATLSFSLSAAGEESGKSAPQESVDGDSASPSGVETLETARAWHDEGVVGDKSAVVKAEKALRQLVLKEPTNALARVFLGSALTLRARDVRFPTTKLRYAREGLAEMDRAVELAPDDVTVRFARAANNSELPSMLRREAIAVADAAWLWEQVRQPPAQAKGASLEATEDADKVAAGEVRTDGTVGVTFVHGIDFRQQVGLLYGRMLERKKDYEGASAVWSEALAWDLESDAGVELQRLLESVRRRGRRGG